jgi:hypothetical protein
MAQKVSLLGSRTSSFPEDEACGGAQRLEILDVEVISGNFQPEFFFNKCRQLDGKQGVDKPTFEKVIVVAKIRDIDGPNKKTSDRRFDIFAIAVH